MSELSASADAYARKNQSMVLRALASVGQASVAAQLGVNESTVSRWKDADIERFTRLLAVLGLKITPQSMRCYDERTLTAMLTLARQRMDQIENVEQIAWEDE